MPKEYTHCVAGYVKKGRSRKDAKRICAGMYYKRHGKTVQQAKKDGDEEVAVPSLLKDLPGEEELIAMESELICTTEPLEVVEEYDGVLEEGDEKPFRYKGVAIYDNVISANNRLYDELFCKRLRRRTMEAINNGRIITVHARHGRALGSMFSMPTHMMIGRVDKLVKEGRKTVYYATLANTRDAKDAENLIRGGFITATSIRATDYESEFVKLDDDREVEKMTTAVLDGIDLAERPGVPGAGIVQILEEAPEVTPITISEGDDDMPEIIWQDVTLEMLQENAPQLLLEHKQSWGEEYSKELADKVQQASQELIDDAVAKLEAERASVKSLTADRDAAATKLAELGLSVAILEASQNPLTALVASKLQKRVKTAEDITDALTTEVLEEARKEVLASAGFSPTPAPGGRVTNPDGASLKSWQQDILRLA